MKKLFCVFFTCFNFNLNSVEFNLITTYYDEKIFARCLEYEECFKKNIVNQYIKKIFVFYETNNDTTPLPIFLCHPKVNILKTKKRPTFNDFFNFLNKNLTKELVIICNTDIFFDESLSVLQNFNFSKKAIVLTRHNIPEYQGKWKRHILSFDAWIYKAPLYISLNSAIGQWGCDIEMLFILKKTGLKIFNPSLTIKAWHVHLNDYREYYDNKLLLNYIKKVEKNINFKYGTKIYIPFSEIKNSKIIPDFSSRQL